ncbi:zinc finger protein 771-like isoform X2 [Corythoichthys intestinalis]|uniref:zinc finger protein 771-like isoform X2 n=1 Tax=Corythoichthys intestinalis TaxID=161448 RepID=UPI0025A66933|nr:zinc finger protein 771-like isoform X2 [Corythoichthys intestinalis]
MRRTTRVPKEQNGTERKRKRKRLFEDAVPTNFSHSVTYLLMAGAARVEHEFVDSDNFTSLEDLKEKIKREIPRNYRISLDKDASEQNRQFLTLFTCEPVLGTLPAMTNMLRIGEFGSFLMTKGGVRIANSKLRHILHSHRDVFTRVSQVTDALAFLNNYSVEETDKCPADVPVEDLYPEKPDPLHAKQDEESEMLYIKQEGEPETRDIKEEQMEDEITNFPVIVNMKIEEYAETSSIKEEDQEDEGTKFSMSVGVKSEEGDGPSEESGAAKPWSDSSFQHLTTAGERLSQPDGPLAALSDNDDITSHSSDFNTDDEDVDVDHNASKSLNKSSLNRESKECVGRKPFACSRCDKTFSWKQSFTKHMRTHTEGKKSFACSFCLKIFTQRLQLTIHTRTHTEKEKPFHCSICGSGFSQKGNLKAHARLHTGEKPFACSFCNKRFYFKNRLTRHVRAHTGEKPYVCTCCGKGFTRKANLNRHTESHTGEKPFAARAVVKESFGRDI